LGGEWRRRQVERLRRVTGEQGKSNVKSPALQHRRRGTQIRIRNYRPGHPPAVEGVASPAPGGGISSTVPLTTCQVISLDVDLYASVPSTATQLQGNSLVAIDPVSGSPGTSLNIGSDPNRISESSDGQYLYVGLDGSLSLTRVDLTSMAQGPVYSLRLPCTPAPCRGPSFAARDLAVAPGNDNLLAIDRGYPSGGVGLLDISGSTATTGPNLAGMYTGSNIAFPNATTVYSYDSDTSGAEFYRWTVPVLDSR